MTTRSKGGRPTVMTRELVNKLEEVFALGGTDAEACLYAGISRQTLYDYQTKNPEFIDRKELLKENPFLKARRTIIKSLDNPHDAQWFMERKNKKEFAQRTEITDADGKPFTVNVIKYEDDNTTPPIQTKELSTTNT